MDLITMTLISTMNLFGEDKRLANLENDLSRAIFKTGEHTWESLKYLFSDETESLGDALVNSIPVLFFGLLTKFEFDLLLETERRRAEIRQLLYPSLPVPFLPISSPTRLRITGGVSATTLKRLPVRKKLRPRVRIKKLIN